MLLLKGLSSSSAFSTPDKHNLRLDYNHSNCLQIASKKKLRFSYLHALFHKLEVLQPKRLASTPSCLLGSH